MQYIYIQMTQGPTLGLMTFAVEITAVDTEYEGGGVDGKWL